MNLFEIIVNGETGQKIFEDDLYAKYKASQEIGPLNITISRDRLKTANLTIHSALIRFDLEQTCLWEFQEENHRTAEEVYEVRDPVRHTIWLGCRSIPILTVQAESAYVIHSSDRLKTQISNGKIQYRFTGQKGTLAAFTILEYTDEAPSHSAFLLPQSAYEKRPLKLFTQETAAGLEAFFSFYILGNIHRPGTRDRQRTTVPCEMLAYAIYNYYNYLHINTSKAIYDNLATIIGYTAALRQHKKGYWIHPCWTNNTTEIHTRMQLEGILLTSDLYQKTGKTLFLESARQAADYLISIADYFSSGAKWFLHDSLEFSADSAKQHYKKMQCGNQFGKSSSNTLALNTHIFTMIVLSRFGQNQNYLTEIASGHAALLEVLKASPAGGLYGFLFTLLDWLRKAAAHCRSKYVYKIYILYRTFFRNRLLSLKSRFPRVYFNNGYIERDLCASSQLDNYHLLNISDLLTLVRYRPCDEIISRIRKSMQYTLDCGMIDIDLKKSAFLSNFAVEALWLYACLIDEKKLDDLQNLLRQLVTQHVPLSLDLLTKPLLVNTAVHFQWQQADPDVITLIAVDQSFYYGIIFNTSPEVKLIQLEKVSGESADQLIFVQNRTQINDVFKPLKIEAFEYIKILKLRESTANDEKNQYS